MGKRSQRLARRQENIGCMWGLIGMLYFRRDAKFLLDRKQGSRRHTFGGLSGRRHSRKKSRDFEETDEYGEDVSYFSKYVILMVKSIDAHAGGCCCLLLLTARICNRSLVILTILDYSVTCVTK